MHALIDSLQREWPIQRWAKVPQLLAVSGGADSVALLRAMVELSHDRQMIYVAHFNHGWRGTESDDDEAFVRDLCNELGLHLEVGSAREKSSRPADRNLGSGNKTEGAILRSSAFTKSEESARKLRYHFLSRVAAKLGIDLVLTAHTASDRVETMLHNLCRGTGLAGMCSPALLRKMRSGITLVRPLIGCFRPQIESYLSDLKQPYRNDSTNRDQAFRRNFLRASVIPLLQGVYGNNLEHRLLSFSRIAEETIHSQRLLADDYLQSVKSMCRDSAEIKRIALSNQRAIILPDHSRLPAPWPIVRTAISETWHMHGWPQQSLAKRHWEQIHSYWSSSVPEHSLMESNDQKASNKPAIILPGRIRLQSLNRWIILRASTENLSENLPVEGK